MLKKINSGTSVTSHLSKIPLFLKNKIKIFLEFLTWIFRPTVSTRGSQLWFLPCHLHFYYHLISLEIRSPVGHQHSLMLNGETSWDFIPLKIFSPFRVNFVNQYCFVHGTYFVPLDQQLAFEEEERWGSPEWTSIIDLLTFRTKVSIQYYQWVPYVFALQAFLFYIPRFIWKAMIAYSGELFVWQKSV